MTADGRVLPPDQPLAIPPRPRRLARRHVWLVPGLAIAIYANAQSAQHGHGLGVLLLFGIVPHLPALLGMASRMLPGTWHGARYRSSTSCITRCRRWWCSGRRGGCPVAVLVRRCLGLVLAHRGRPGLRQWPAHGRRHDGDVSAPATSGRGRRSGRVGARYGPTNVLFASTVSSLDSPANSVMRMTLLGAFA